MISDDFKNIFLTRGSTSYEILVYIKDTNDKWVDFSNRVLSKNTLLANLSTIKFSNENNSLTPVMVSQLSSIDMGNSKGFWDKPFPTMYTEDGSTASFTTSKGSQLSIVEDHDIQFRIKLTTGKSEEIYNLVTLRIESIVTTETRATLTLRSYSQILKERSAEKVKTRDGWYQYKTIPFLVRELLKLEFSDENGELPSTFTIPQTIELTNPDNERVFSILGRPPTNIDTNSDGIAEKTYDSTLTPRWILGLSCDPTAIGSTTPDDSIENITYLLFGCDNKLYSYCIATDVYELLDSVNSDYHIERLWLNDRDGKIYGMALTTMTQIGQGVVEQAMKIFRYNGTSISELFTVPSTSTLTDFFYSGFYTKRRGRVLDQNPGAGTQYFNLIGSFSGTGTPSTEGYNIPILFSQYIKGDLVLGTYSWYIKHGDYENEDLSSVTSQAEGWTQRGYIAAGYQGDIEAPTQQTANQATSLNISFNSKGFLLFDENYGANGCMIYATIDVPRVEYTGGPPFNTVTNYVEIIKIYRVNTLVEGGGDYNEVEVSSDLKNDYPTIGELPVHPTCGEVRGDNLWICGTSFGIGTSNHQMGHAILKIDLGDNSQSTLLEYDTYDDDLRVFLECIYYLGTSSGGYLILVSCSPYRATTDAVKTPIYHIDKFDLDTNTLTNIADFTSQPMSLTVGDAINELNQYIYFIDSSSGALKKINTSTWTIEVENDGKSITETEFAVYSNLIYESNTNSIGVVWGVSHPNSFREESFEGYVPGEGKYQLFKYDTNYYPIIELADFNGLNIWEAISLLTQKCYHIVGFNENGDFYMVSRDISSNDIDHTLDENYQPLIIKNDRGFKEIANSIRVIPYYSKLGTLEYEFLIKARSGEEDVNTVGEDEIVLRQSGTRSQIIRMYCIRGGDGNVGSDTYLGYPLFKFLLYENTIELKLTSGALATDTTLYLSSVYGGDDADGGVHTGDYVAFESVDGGEITRRITGDLTGGNIDYDDVGITIDSALGEAFSSGTIIKVYRKYRPTSTDSDYGKQWSDEGITYVDGAHSAQTTLTVQSTENLCKNTVVQIEGTTSGTTFEVRISSIDEDNNQITVSSAVTCADGATVKAYWAPYESGTCFYIGGTGVGIVLDSGTAKCEFRVGDIFTITAPGLILEEDARSPQIAYDVTSIAKYGEREFEIKNRFFNRRDAEFLSKYLLNEFKNPRMIIEAMTSYMPFITMINDDNQMTKSSVISSKRFPNMPKNQIAGYTRTIQHQPMSNRTTLLIRSVEDY